MRWLSVSILAPGLLLLTATAAGCKADIGDPCGTVDDCELGLVCIADEATGRSLCQLPPAAEDLRSAEPSDLGPPDEGT